jgi:hypothetical protein
LSKALQTQGERQANIVKKFIENALTIARSHPMKNLAGGWSNRWINRE